MPIERVLIEINKREMEDKKKSKNTVTCIEQQDEKWIEFFFFSFFN